jgi:hypothetical protein
MRIRNRHVIFSLVYGLLVVAGAVAVSRREHPWRAEAAGHWRAARDLQPNHQLRTNDLVEPMALSHRIGLPPKATLVGKHVTARVRRGAVVNANSLSPFPSIPKPAQGRMQFTYVPAATEVEWLATVDVPSEVRACYRPEDADSAGTRRWVCTDSGTIVYGVHLRISRENDSVGVLWVVLESDTSPLSTGFVGAKNRFLARPSRAAVQPPALSGDAASH